MKSDDELKLHQFLIFFDQEMVNDGDLNIICESICEFYKNRSLRLSFNSIVVFLKHINRFTFEEILSDIDDIIKADEEEKKMGYNFFVFQIEYSELKIQASQFTNELKFIEDKILKG